MFLDVSREEAILRVLKTLACCMLMAIRLTNRFFQCMHSCRQIAWRLLEQLQYESGSGASASVSSVLLLLKVLILAKWGFLEKGLLLITRTWNFPQTLFSTSSLEICSQKLRDTAPATVLLVWNFQNSARAAPNRSPTQVIWHVLFSP